MMAKKIWRVLSLTMAVAWVLFTPYSLCTHEALPCWYALLWGLLGVVGMGSVLWEGYKAGQWKVPWPPWVQLIVDVIVVAATLGAMKQVSSDWQRARAAAGGFMLLAFFYAEGVLWVYHQLRHGETDKDREETNHAYHSH